jgi:cephalosporin-C deacetylase-like acetyl esterase
MLRQREVPLRPDWEAVVTPVVDFAVGIPEVDQKRMVLIGRSFGGYLARVARPSSIASLQ